MIEGIVIDYLSDALSVPVSGEITDKHPKQVTVSRGGSTEDDYIETAMIVIDSYANTMLQAAELNDSVKKEMKRIVELDSISACYLVTDYMHTHTAGKRYRYQAVFNITYF